MGRVLTLGSSGGPSQASLGAPLRPAPPASLCAAPSVWPKGRCQGPRPRSDGAPTPATQGPAGSRGASACSPNGQEGSSPVPEPAEGPRAGFAPGVTPSRGAVGTPQAGEELVFSVPSRSHSEPQTWARPPVFLALEVGEPSWPTEAVVPGMSAATLLPQVHDLADPQGALPPGKAPGWSSGGAGADPQTRGPRPWPRHGLHVGCAAAMRV